MCNLKMAFNFSIRSHRIHNMSIWAVQLRPPFWMSIWVVERVILKLEYFKSSIL
jgi:hypothetical protein